MMNKELDEEEQEEADREAKLFAALTELVERFLSPNIMQVLIDKACYIREEGRYNRLSFSIDYSIWGGKAHDPYISRVAIEAIPYEKQNGPKTS